MSDPRKPNLYINTIKFQVDPILSPSEYSDCANLQKQDIHTLACYNLIDEAYFKAGTYYTRQSILTFLAFEVKNQLSWDIRKALYLIFHISAIFHLNLLEIIYWSLLLHKVPESIFRPGLFAYFTAYEAKAKLNSDISIYDAYINTAIPNFKILFNNWQIIVDFVEPTIRDVNLKYSQMIREKRCYKNYDEMVDKIMELPRRKESILTEVTETSHIEDMEHELEIFQREFLKGERLSPI
jgi:hypothetical protein